MKLKDLLLKPEELPILHETCFQVPIHPKLFNQDLRINEEIAKIIFPKIAKNWSKQFNKEFPRSWKGLYQTSKNGLVENFSISRDHGGGLYFLREDINCTAVGHHYLRFTEEKWDEFVADKKKIYTYVQHNVDDFEGATFLRNWAMTYMNKVLKEVFND